MTPKEREAMQQALGALEACVEKFYAMKSTGVIGALPMQAVKAAQAITALREALSEPQITTPDVCGEVCARAKLCYGCNKDLEEANAKYAEQAEQEPVALLQLAEDALVYHTEQTRPIQNTIDALVAIQKFKEKQR